MLYDLQSFNPYFNGYSTLTINIQISGPVYYICFNPYFNGYSTLTALQIAANNTIRLKCFNPYFNGYSTLTNEVMDALAKEYPGFNPYFNGYSTLTIF